jgi:hypothetical protein
MSVAMHRYARVMAMLIPSLSNCTFDSGGEARLAERLSKLATDTVCWFNIPVGPSSVRPDFIVMNPNRGLLVLEVKDWHPETVARIDRLSVTIRTPSGEQTVKNPFEQARSYAFTIVDVLKRDPKLTFKGGPNMGKLTFPWSFGVVLSHITRKQFDELGFEDVIASDRVICRDEMFESVDPVDFERRLWAMVSNAFPAALSDMQVDRVRWHLFPEVRIPSRQATLFGDVPPLDLMQVMDLTQEQLARCLGPGHRVIHGVAGSGKTVILVHRVAYLAKAVSKPILVLCYNEALAKWLTQTIRAKGLSEKVHTYNFHKWCRTQLMTHDVALPAANEDANAYFRDLVDSAITEVERGIIPSGQYSAVFIDEGHDFRPEWLKLVVQMVDPVTKSLLIAYDDAQSIYPDARDAGGSKFSFKRVGIEAAGRTTILKVNYRNTDEVLSFARNVAEKILKPADATDDGIPLLFPQCAGRHGPKPLLVTKAGVREEAEFIAQHFKEAHRAGTPWRDMAVIYRHYNPVGETVAGLLRAYGIPVLNFREAHFTPDEDKVMTITMHSCKGLEFPLVAIPGVDRMQEPGDEALSAEQARLLYVAMTRATRELVVSGSSGA